MDPEISETTRRRGSNASLTSVLSTASIRQRKDMDTVDEDVSPIGLQMIYWREELQELISDEGNRVTKAVGGKLMKIFGRVEQLIEELKMDNAYMKGRLDGGVRY